MIIEGLQHIKQNGIPFVQMPEASFRLLLEQLEDAEDAAALAAAKERLAEGEEIFPSELAFALAATETTGERIALFREYRNMSRKSLGEKTGVSGQHIGMIEAGKRKGDITLLKKLAAALAVELSDLV